MKKIIALIAALITAFIFFGCSNTVEVKFLDMGYVIADNPDNYERCVYSAEIHNGKAGADKVSYTDGAVSQMILEFEKTEGGLARVIMTSTIKYTETPPYVGAVLTHTGENWRNLSAEAQKTAYGGLTDTITSEVVFNGYSQDFNPVSVKKSAVLETSKKFDEKDKSFTAEFDYLAQKKSGAGKYADSAGAETEFSVKSKNLKNVFDNEQLYYMVSAFMRGTLNKDTNKPALGYSKQYKVFNLADRCINGKGASSWSFAVKDTPRADYCNIKADIAEVTVSFSQGQPLNMYYSLTEKLTIGDAPKTARELLMLGYEQKINRDVSTTLSVSTYILKEYSIGR